MLIKLKIYKMSDEDLYERNPNLVNDLNDYEETNNSNLMSKIISYEDEKYEHIFIFSNLMDVNFLKNKFIEMNIEILEFEDFTDTLINLIKENKLNEFKNKFDYFETLEDNFENFILRNITKDDVLDKIIDFGKSSLTDLENKILNS